MAVGDEMAKIILAMDGTVLREVTLSKKRVSIGRGSHNDIVIEDLAVSAEHAAIVTVDGGSFLEDLNSTNGTQVNGQPVKQHFLQDGDMVELAGYQVWYINERILVAPTEPEEGIGGVAVIKVMNGPNAGKEISLAKALTTLGWPDSQVAVITRRLEGYYLVHIAGRVYPTVNGNPIEEQPLQMRNGDVIDLSGGRMQFLLLR